MSTDQITDMYTRALLAASRESLPFFRVEPKKLTRAQYLKRRVMAYVERVRDAWLVLIGKACVGDDW